MTRSPGWSGLPAVSRSSPSPSAWTVPVISWPRIWGYGHPNFATSNSPRHWWRSEPQTFATVILITAAPGSGSGTGYALISIGLPGP